LNGSDIFSPDVDWPGLLNRVNQHEIGAEAELYALISGGILFFLRQLSTQVAEDEMQRIFQSVLTAIHDGNIGDPYAFPGFVVALVKGHLLSIDPKINDERDR